jgi:hypothetical protein
MRIVSGARFCLRVARWALGRNSAPCAPVNQGVRAGRRIRFFRMDLATVRQAVHAREGKVNDVVLDLVGEGTASPSWSPG